MTIWAICFNTYLEAVRNKILYTVLLFMALLLAAAAFFGSVTIGDRTQVIKDCGLFSLSFFGAILTIVTGVSLLSKEIKQKTIYNILSKPVSRWQFLLGKQLGLTLTSSVLVSIMGFGLIGFAWFFEKRIDTLLFQGIALAIMEVIVLASIVIFFSSLAITTTLPGVFTLAAYIVGHSIRYLQYFVGDEQNNSQIITIAVKMLSWVVPDLSLFNANDSLVYGQALTLSQVLYSFCYSLSYSLLMLTVASIIFSKRELS